MSKGDSTRLASLLLAGLPAFAYMFTVGSIGFWLPLFVREVAGYSYTETELIATVYFVSLALGGLLAGIITDRTGRPGLTAFAGLGVNGFVILLMEHYYGFEEMLLLRVLQGLALSTAIPVALGSLSLIAGESLGVGMTSLLMSSGMALGSLIGGLLIAGPGYSALFTLSGGLSLLAAIASLRIRAAKPPTRLPRIREIAGHIRGPVALVLVGILLRQLLATGVYALLAVYFRQVLGLSLLLTAAALSINPIVQSVLSIPLSRAAPRAGGSLYSLGVTLTGAVFALILYSSRSPMLALASMIVQGFAFAMVNVSGNYIVISLLPEKIRYTASSLFNLAFNLGWVAGTLLTGLALTRLDPLAWLVVAAIGVSLLGVALQAGFLLLSREPRK